MRRVLVTGATGFLGNHLAASLVAAGLEVVCVVRPTASQHMLKRLPVDVREGYLDRGDIFAEALVGVDTVFHVAGQTRAFRRSELQRSNVGVTACVAQACARRETPPRLVVVSSLAAAGPAIEGRPLDPSRMARPVSNYGRSKREAELAACRWADQLALSIVRPGIVFGPHNREMFPMFQSVGCLGVFAVPGFTARRVALIHVRDLANLLQIVAVRGRCVAGGGPDASAPGLGCYDACYSQQPTYAELGTLIGQALGQTRVVPLYLPDMLTWFLAAGSEAFSRVCGRLHPLNVDKAREATAGSWLGDAERLTQELGFAPQFTLATGLRDAADWYRHAGWLHAGTPCAGSNNSRQGAI